MVTVWDGDKPYVRHGDKEFTIDEIMGEDAGVIYDKNDGVRNLGFAYVAKYLPEIEIYQTYDDDTEPFGDTIQDHITALNMRVPITKWLNTLQDIYPRGFPYGIRDEAPVMVSHGLWNTVLDLDAPTQLVMGSNVKSKYNKFAVPKGCYIPVCGMALAFRKEALPYVYYAPMGHRAGIDRFADIYMGVTMKDSLDKKGWALVTGYAEVTHKRASNVFVNLIKEAKGLSMHETWDDGYFDIYNKELSNWRCFLKKC